MPLKSIFGALFLLMILTVEISEAAPAKTHVRASRPVRSDLSCSNLRRGTNTLAVGERTRRLDLYLPSELAANPPILFIWHGLRDKPANIARWFGAQDAAERHGAIVVVPHSSGQFPLSEWSFSGVHTAVDADFFDRALVCLKKQFGASPRRIYTTGFSAGALWSTWLLMNRSHQLAAVALFSGGTGDFLRYKSPEHDIPVLAIHGGSSDIFGGRVDFSRMTMALVRRLVMDGHSVIYCDHGRGHRVPFQPSAFAMPFLFEQISGQVSKKAQLTGRWPGYCQRGEVE